MGAQISTRFDRCIRPAPLGEAADTLAEKVSEDTCGNADLDGLVMAPLEIQADSATKTFPSTTTSSPSTTTSRDEDIPITTTTETAIPADFDTGDEVLVVGLEATPQHNGERGRVVGRQGDRLKVMLATGKGLALRPQNLANSRGRSSRARA